MSLKERDEEEARKEARAPVFTVWAHLSCEALWICSRRDWTLDAEMMFWNWAAILRQFEIRITTIREMPPRQLDTLRVTGGTGLITFREMLQHLIAAYELKVRR